MAARPVPRRCRPGLAELLVEQRFVHARLVAVEHALARRRLAHRLQHHLQEQGLELPRHDLVGRRITRLGLPLERGEAADIEDVGCGGCRGLVVKRGHGNCQNRMPSRGRSGNERG
jgi:hypothetical protein